MPLTTVYIPDRQGREYATNVEAETVEIAVKQACEFFNDNFWKGPKPQRGTILRVCPMGGEEMYVKL